MNNENIVKSIKNLCKENNITIGQLEKEVGLSQGLVSKWKDKTPSLDKIVDIADYFNVTLDEVIGRTNNLKDDFLQMLYRQTSSCILKWNVLDDSADQNISKPTIYGEITDIKNKTHTYYNQSIYKEYFYYTSYNNGFIIIGSVCAKHEFNNPQYVSLYIQPTEKSEAIRQNYTKNQLKTLWIKVLRSLSDKTPSEILIEDFKQQMLANEEVDILKHCQDFIKRTPDTKNDVDKLLNDNNAKKILIEANDSSIQQLISTFSNPKVLQTIDATNRLVQYMSEIDKLRNKKDKQN